MKGRQIKVGPYLDNFNVVLEEEAVGHGGHPEVVNVVSPGAALPHLGAHHPVRVHHLHGADIRILIQARNINQTGTNLSECSVCREKSEVNGPSEVDELKTQWRVLKHFLGRLGLSGQRRNRLQEID